MKIISLFFWFCVGWTNDEIGWYLKIIPLCWNLLLCGLLLNETRLKQFVLWFSSLSPFVIQNLISTHFFFKPPQYSRSFDVRFYSRTRCGILFHEFLFLFVWICWSLLSSLMKVGEYWLAHLPEFEPFKKWMEELRWIIIWTKCRVVDEWIYLRHVYSGHWSYVSVSILLNMVLTTVLTKIKCPLIVMVGHNSMNQFFLNL